MNPSHVRSAATAPLITTTIGEALRRIAGLYPESLALAAPHQGVGWTWVELDRRVDQVATGLWAHGVKCGDRLGIWAPNCAEWVLTQLACARAGVILVTINPAYRAYELRHALNLTKCKALVVAKAYKDADFVAILAEARADGLSHLDLVITLEGASGGDVSFADIAQTSADVAALDAIAAKLTPDDAINIQFTSGTTGAPKGATLTHHNILNNGALVGAGLALTVEDRVCVPVPLYHCFGMVMGVLACVAHGSAIVLPCPVFNPGDVLNAVAEERCTALYGVPTMFVAELDFPGFGSFDLSSLRTGIMAGAPCPMELMKRVIADMHMRDITICYGMTETSPVSFQTTLQSDLDTRVGTVGTIHPHLEAKIIDEAGAVTARGVKGELLVRGYSVMQGYWDDPERTMDAIDVDGWMHTGDLATLDDEGRARIVGRVKDMIIRGGENIYPAEIENFLYTHPAIAEAAVFGVPSERYGEEVCVWVRARSPLTEAELKAFCKGKIAAFKIPKYIRFVEALPMTVTGKVQKFVMRDAMASEFASV